MDIKKILQAVDGASSKKPAEGSNDMKHFMQIVEGRGPLNRLTQAESIAMQTAAKKKTITSPVLNVKEDAKPSMIGKYFKTVQEELLEAEQKHKERSKKLAERVIERVTIPPDGNTQIMPIPQPASQPAPTNVKPSGATVEYGGATYNLVGVFGDGIRPRISRGDKVIPGKAYVVGDKMYVLLDQGVSEDSDPCWDSHKMVGTKKKGGKTVPNCVPKEAVNPAQQAAIAIAKKKAGKK